MVRLFMSAMILLCFLASQSQAHGLAMSEGKTLLYDRIDDIMVKIELSPNDLQFNQENEMEVSVIDVANGGIFNRKIQLKISQLDEDNNVSIIFTGDYQKGIFKETIDFPSGGSHKLEFSLENDLPGKKKVFTFKFELKDNRRFAYTAALAAISFFAVFACIAGFIIRYRRNQ
jgi:hypothetical protein